MTGRATLRSMNPVAAALAAYENGEQDWDTTLPLLIAADYGMRPARPKTLAEITARWHDGENPPKPGPWQDLLSARGRGVLTAAQFLAVLDGLQAARTVPSGS